ncbi:MAG: hypothetical protein O9312_07675 [Hylemonella sp.]|nr:hypothetical protein [Hylemonella sp.]
MVLSGLAGVSHAQQSAAERYPWDVRPAKCATPEASGTDTCRIDDWPTYAITAGRLNMLASTGRYALLERTLAELAHSGKRFPDGENTARVVLDTIEEKAMEHRLWAVGDSPLNRWRAQFPASEFVLIADAMLLDPVQGEAKLQAISSAFKATGVWTLARQRLNSDRQRLAVASLPEARYPWDHRPGKCRFPGAAASDLCKLNDWPDQSTTVERLQLLLERSEFVLLERALNELASSGDVFAGGSSPAATAYSVLEWILEQDARTPPADSWLVPWRKAQPDSTMLKMLEAIQLQHKAWEVRGSGYASTVSTESWEIFALRLKQAEQVLLDMPEGLRKTALWHMALLRVEQDNRKPLVKPDVVFRNAVRQWPLHLDFYVTMAYRKLPQWGGSWKEVEAFIDHWSRQVEPTQGQSFYARLYVQLSGQMTPQTTTAMKWSRLQAGFEDWLARDPTPYAKNMYASFACRARDKSAFGKALGRITPAELAPEVWLGEYSHEVCTRWAGS